MHCTNVFESHPIRSKDKKIAHNWNVSLWAKFCRGMGIEPVGLAPVKSIKHMGYENTSRDVEISTRQLHM